MKLRRTLVLCLILVLLASTLTVSGQDDENPLLRLLRFVPNTLENREWIIYGDLAAWHESWGVPRVETFAELETLDRDPQAYWMFIMSSQTLPPDALGMRFLRVEDMRPFYGFNLFNVDRFLEAGETPHTIAVVEHNLDSAQIADTLTASGYEASPLGDTAQLYSLLDDYAMVRDDSVPRVGRMGSLNRIGLIDGQMLIGRATAVVTAAVETAQGESASLADDPMYKAAVQALDDPALDDTGDLVGAILLPGTSSVFLGDPIAMLMDQDVTAETLTERYGPDPLPPFMLAAFATRHTPGATYLILALVFLPGTDASAAADIVAYRLQRYVSTNTHQPLDERWTFDRATATEAEGYPVALIAMRADDPPIAPEGEQANTAVFNWATLIYPNDLGFLFVGTIDG